MASIISRSVWLLRVERVLSTTALPSLPQVLDLNTPSNGQQRKHTECGYSRDFLSTRLSKVRSQTGEASFLVDKLERDAEQFLAGLSTRNVLFHDYIVVSLF